MKQLTNKQTNKTGYIENYRYTMVPQFLSNLVTIAFILFRVIVREVMHINYTHCILLQTDGDYQYILSSNL